MKIVVIGGTGLIGSRSLVPLDEARLGRIGLDEWLLRSRRQP